MRGPATESLDAHTARYDGWFDRHAGAYGSELAALKALRPTGGRWLEVGAGTGRLALPLGIPPGLEPSRPMARLGRQ